MMDFLGYLGLTIFVVVLFILDEGYAERKRVKKFEEDEW